MQELNKKLLLTFAVVTVSILLSIAAIPWIVHAKDNYPFPEKFEEYENKPQVPLFGKIVTYPVMEEIIFRFPVLFIFGKYISRYRHKKATAGILVIATGLIFGVLHIFNGGLYLLIPVIFSISLNGILLNILILRTGHVAYPILAHSSINFIVEAI